jgi:hypothetical protein
MLIATSSCRSSGTCPEKERFQGTCVTTANSLRGIAMPIGMWERDPREYTMIGETLVSNALACVRGSAHEPVAAAAARYRAAVAQDRWGDAMREAGEIGTIVKNPRSRTWPGCGGSACLRKDLCDRVSSTLRDVETALNAGASADTMVALSMPIVQLAATCVFDNADDQSIRQAIQDYSLGASLYKSRGRSEDRAAALQELRQVREVVDAEAGRRTVPCSSWSWNVP